MSNETFASPTAPGAPVETARDAASPRPWVKRIGALTAAAVVGYGEHRGFHSDLAVLGNLSERASGASEVAEIGVISGTLAFAGLKNHIGRGFRELRRYKSSRDLDRIEAAIPHQKDIVRDTGRIIRGVRTGKNVMDLDAPEGAVLTKGHHRRARKANNVRDKAHALEYEVQGLERFIGQPVGAFHVKVGDTNEYLGFSKVPTVEVVERDGFKRRIPISTSDIGSATQKWRVNSIPRTEEERAMFAQAVKTHRHELHKAHEIRERGREAIFGKEEEGLATLKSVQSTLNERLDKQDGWVPRLEDRPTKTGRAYATARDAGLAVGAAKRKIKPRLKAIERGLRNNWENYKAAPAEYREDLAGKVYGVSKKIGKQGTGATWHRLRASGRGYLAVPSAYRKGQQGIDVPDTRKQRTLNAVARGAGLALGTVKREYKPSNVKAAVKRDVESIRARRAGRAAEAGRPTKEERKRQKQAEKAQRQAENKRGVV